jgi:predicted PurR-regulated permease PerM
LPKINAFIYQFFVELVAAITGISIAVALTPFILYYFLRDDALFQQYVLRYTPQKHQGEVEKILHDVDLTLSGFIFTQATIALIIGIFLSIGYAIIGLPYALLLSLFAMVFYVIPFLGTFIAIIPALLIAASIHVSMVIKVIIIMLLAHFIEAYFVTPRLMSNSLKIHPLTIICLLLIGGSVFGILGLILITPTYAIVKVVVWNIYKITRLHYAQAKLQETLKAVEAENAENAENGKE